jgi:hypothetical protein
MLVYTLLFTQVGQSPETNPYISKFAKWLAHIIHFGDLNYLDTVILIIDDVTKEFFDKDHNCINKSQLYPLTSIITESSNLFQRLKESVKNIRVLLVYLVHIQ